MLVFELMGYCARVCVDGLLCMCLCCVIVLAFVLCVFNGVNYDCEIGWACSTYGGKKRHVKDFGGDTLGKETTCKTQA